MRRPPAEEGLGPPEAGEARKEPALEAAEGVLLLGHPDSRLLAYRTWRE